MTKNKLRSLLDPRSQFGEIKQIQGGFLLPDGIALNEIELTVLFQHGLEYISAEDISAFPGDQLPKLYLKFRNIK